MRFLTDRSLLLIIDFQERIFPAIHENEKLLRNVPILIRGIREMKIPVIVTEQYVKGLGPTVAPIAETLNGINRIEKSSFSCCDESAFNMALATSGRENVIVAGIESHVCVLQTVIDLRRHGYYPIVVEDCVSSRKLNDKLIALERMKLEGIRLTTYESILFELLRFSGTDTFRAISKLVK